MKKNVIALLLSVVLAAGSIGTVPALAAETAVQEETSGENLEETGREAVLASEEDEEAEGDQLTEEASAAETEQAAEEEEETETDEPAEDASEAETEQAAEEEPEEGTEDADAGLTDEESSEGESAQETEEEPEQTDAESVDEDENADEQDQTAAVEEDADDEIDDSATIADTEETAVTEEESIIEESKEAKLAGNVVASGTCGANATWTLTGTDDDLTLTISGSGDMDDFEKSDIPWASKQAKIKTLIVEDGITRVGDYAFYSLNKLTNVSLADSVKKLWHNCFSNCVSLKSITLPASVTYIGWSAFSGCSSLTSITIPDSADIGGNAFEGCSSLTSITIPSSVTDIGWYAFSGCSNLTSITIPDSVTEIGGYAFEGCSGLTSITFPDSVTSIGEYAFYGCSSLTSITIPDSVTSIGKYAFDFCNSLEKIHINSLEAWLNIDDYSSYLSGNLYLNGELITNAIIPEGITKIRDGAFYGCSGLTSITIPDSVTSIGERAFYDCSSLEKMHINSLEAWLSIDDDSYHECNLYLNGELLTNAIIPDGITHIRDCAFRGCSRLRNVTIPDSVISIGSFAFEYCSSLKSITIPDSVISIGSSAFEGCSSLKSITIPNNVKEIDQYAFLGVELEKIQINSLETWLGLYDDYSYLSGPLYLNGKLLTDAVIPAGITRIRDYAFNGCSSLRSVTIPDSVTVIGISAFYKCNNLTSVTIPDSVTEIEAHAFSGCSLTDITIPDSVTSMDQRVFDDCSNLTKIVVGSGIKSISPSVVIDQCVGDNLTEDGTFAYDGFLGHCENLKSVTIKHGMTEIKGYAFLGYSNLTSVTIPASVTRIGGHAFKHCGSLRSVTIPASVTDIGEGAFGGPATKISVRFCGTKAQWDAATAGRDVYCNSITYNCFSVDAAVSLSGTSFTYNKKAIKPAVTVTYGGKKLVEGTDYKLVYKNNINAGKATVYINGTGKYSGTVTRTFTIKKAVNKITAKNFTLGYSAKKRSFALEAKITNGTPKYASNSKSVTVSAKGVVTVSPKFIGKATITITAPEYINYSKTTKKVTVTVRPPRSAFKSVTNSASRQMTLKWITSPMVTGYHIQYSVSSKFTKFKSIWITKGSINTSTVKNLTKGKKYYVRIRTIKTVGGVKYYSGWSDVKAVTIKK